MNKKDNYYALLICILRPIPIDVSIQMMVDGVFPKRNTTITDADIEDMIRLKKQGKTHEAIGEIYGLSESATYRRIKRYWERKERKQK